MKLWILVAIFNFGTPEQFEYIAPYPHYTEKSCLIELLDFLEKNAVDSLDSIKCKLSVQIW